MIRVAVDLTWCRHNKVGGTESYIRNVLKGIISANPEDLELNLILAKDNASSFAMYDDSYVKHIVCDVESENVAKRIIWQNMQLRKVLRKHQISILFEPVYSMPFLGMSGIKVITTIHDLQALHYPEYFSKAKVFWMHISWRNAVKKSEKVIAISEFVRDDIINYLKASPEKVVKIYNSIDIDTDECAPDEGLSKYGVEKKGYYYTVSSLLPHKNLNTLVLAMSELYNKNSKVLFPLIISGVGGSEKERITELAEVNGIGEYIKITSYVDNAERNMLYKNCKAFLFPSIFEGFGMPPVEAMVMRVPVVTTKCTSLYEVTGGIVNYVDDPRNELDWVRVIENGPLVVYEQEKFVIENYSNKKVGLDYLRLLYEVANN